LDYAFPLLLAGYLVQAEYQSDSSTD